MLVVYICVHSIAAVAMYTYLLLYLALSYLKY